MHLKALTALAYVSAAATPVAPCLVDPSQSTVSGPPLPAAADVASAFAVSAQASKRSNAFLPRALDYRLSHGVVSPVRDQASCGSCWAFAATEAMEGQLGLDGRPLVLAPQTFIDCVREDWGCGGGWPDDALAYAEEYGIASESAYPYQANASGVCRLTNEHDPPPVAARADVFYEVRANGSDTLLRRALWQYGPLAVAIDASPLFQEYTGGVLNDTMCRQTGPNHAVLLVGYDGTDGGAADYWIVKNSWSATWGEAGYVRLSASSANACGIGMHATVPYIEAAEKAGEAGEAGEADDAGDATPLWLSRHSRHMMAAWVRPTLLQRVAAIAASLVRFAEHEPWHWHDGF